MKGIRRVLTLPLMACMALLVIGMSGCSETEEGVPQLPEPTIESSALLEPGTLHVGVNTNNSPLAGMSNNKIIGIDVDIVAAMADDMGLHLELVDVGSDPDAAIAEKKVDIVMGVDGTNSSKEYWTSEQYLPTGVALFVLENSSDDVPTAEGDPKIAAQVSSKSAWAVTNSFGEEALESETDLASAFGDLNSGKVDYVASDAVIGMYAANRQGVKVKIIALLDNASGYCAAASSENTILQEEIQSALASIKNDGMIEIIERKWLNGVIDLSDVPKVEPKAAPADANTPDEGEGNQAEGGTSNTSNSASGGTSSTKPSNTTARD